MSKISIAPAKRELLQRCLTPQLQVGTLFISEALLVCYVWSTQNLIVDFSKSKYAQYEIKTHYETNTTLYTTLYCYKYLTDIYIIFLVGTKP